MSSAGVSKPQATIPRVAFVTACDFQRLPQALSLFESLESHYSGDMRLWIWSEDAETHEVIDRLNEPRILSLSQLDLYPDEAKAFWSQPHPYRYWYAAAASVLTLLRSQEPHTVIYVDADLWVLKSVDELIQRFTESRASVLLTPHDFDPKYDRHEIVGWYCVQFLPFKQNRASVVVAEEWFRDCLNLPGSHYLASQYGDQKILDSWQDRYSDAVCLSEPAGMFMGPWNARRFPLSSASAYHFQGFRLLSGNRAFIGEYLLPKSLAKDLYHPYLEACVRQMHRIDGLGLSRAEPFGSSIGCFAALRSRMRLLRRAGRRYIRDPFITVGQYT